MSMTVVIIQEQILNFMPEADYISVAGPGADIMAVPDGMSPGSFMERETMAVEGDPPSVFHGGPVESITPSVLGLSDLPGRLYPRSVRG